MHLDLLCLANYGRTPEPQVGQGNVPVAPDLQWGHIEAADLYGIYTCYRLESET